MKYARGLIETFRRQSELLDRRSVAKAYLLKRLRPSAAMDVRCRVFEPPMVRLRPASSDFFTLREVVKDREYEAALEHLPDTPTILDIGANIGLTSRYLLTHRPRASILAVEALGETFELLEQNLLHSGSTRVRALHAAAWSHPTRLQLERPDAGAFSRNRVTNEAAAGEGVQALSMQQILAESSFDHIDFCKIDVEGAEVAILGGDLGWLNHTSLVALEFHGDSRVQSRADELLGAAGLHETHATDHTILYRRG